MNSILSLLSLRCIDVIHPAIVFSTFYGVDCVFFRCVAISWEGFPYAMVIYESNSCY